MAGDWIPWVKGLTRKRETLLIARRTGRSRWEVASQLMEFWEWADGETEDGRLPGLDVRSLSACHAEFGERFFGAMVEAGWLSECDDCIIIPHFDFWMGRSAKRRLRDARRKRHKPGDQTGRPRKLRKTSACEAENLRPTEQNRTEREEPVGSSRERAKNPLWDAVCNTFGLSPATKSERSRVGKIARDLKEKGAAPADVSTRLGAYRRLWPDVSATPEALLKHWDLLAQPDPVAARQAEDRRARDERLLRDREEDRQRLERLKAQAGRNGGPVDAADLFKEEPGGT